MARKKIKEQEKKIEYKKNIAYLHNDDYFMPKNKNVSEIAVSCMESINVGFILHPESISLYDISNGSEKLISSISIPKSDVDEPDSKKVFKLSLNQKNIERNSKIETFLILSVGTDLLILESSPFFFLELEQALKLNVNIKDNNIFKSIFIFLIQFDYS